MRALGLVERAVGARVAVGVRRELERVILHPMAVAGELNAFKSDFGDLFECGFEFAAGKSVGGITDLDHLESLVVFGVSVDNKQSSRQQRSVNHFCRPCHLVRWI